MNDEQITQVLRSAYGDTKPSLHEVFKLGQLLKTHETITIIRKLQEPHRKGSSGRANFDLLLNIMEAADK